MGCLFSGRRSAEESETEPLSQSKYSWEREDRPDPALLTIENQEGGVVGRLPGVVSGRQFRIRNCRDCTILVLDHTKALTIDKCTDCRIFIGPCKGSVYIRNCTDCRCVAACEQFRARDCRKCDVFLHSASQPIIEDCLRMKFGCFSASYPQLKAQFLSAGLNVFNNYWSMVHDFTPNTESGNWSFLPEGTSCLQAPAQGEFAEAGLSFTRGGSVVPNTIGLKQKPSGESCLIVFFSCEGAQDKALEFVRKVRDKVVLVVTREVALNSHEAETVFTGNTELISHANTGPCIFLEVCGSDCVEVCRGVLSGEPEGTVYVSSDPDRGRSDCDEFENFSEKSLAMQ